MSLRDVIIALFVIGSLPTCFRRPFIGLLVFSILGYMRIQDLAWGFARYERWSFYVAITTFAGWYSDPNRRPIIMEVRTIMMALLLVFIAIGLFFAKGWEEVRWAPYIEFCKIIAVAAFTTSVVRTRDHLRALVWVIAMSFGFYGVKSGIAGIATGGNMTINEGPGGMLEDNNNFALAMVMAIPLLVHLATSEKNPAFQRPLRAMVPLTMIAVMMTHSRGGALAMAFAILILVWRSRSRLLGLMIAGLAGLAMLALAPESYVTRLKSIRNYEEDGSARGRLDAWAVAGNMIRSNPMLGVGFDRFKGNYAYYDPKRPNLDGPQPEHYEAKVAHNSYLQIWAECGTPAFLLYMGMLGLSMIDLWILRRRARRRYHASWILSYVTMFEASMAAFFVGSMFLNRAQFDLIYHYIAIVLVFGRIARQEMEDEGRYPVRAGFGYGTLQRVDRPGFNRRLAPRTGFRDTPLLGAGR